ncbi:arylesterase [Gilvimarinus xylanilyticus]|uniref:Arylesterase n=1 Tax=Gilvimarinus xylanilyticus TaxID=2944139 RepID=A0A9X2I0L6_9GAMM|nr:arylesterase [Gilvimarinus xylanilyticus]MCP8898011.1 arylesterase [Gilvimarinus xylanilyticus]
MINRFRRSILVNGCIALLWGLSTLASANTVLVMGDSLSAGYGIDLEDGWVQQLRTKLEETHPQYQVINASVSGETTTGGRARLNKLLQTHSPSIVVIELGGNDGLRGQPLNIVRENLSDMIKQSQQAEARVLLVGMQIPPNYGARYTQAFSELFAELAKEHETALVPFLLDGVALDKNLMQNDSIHPTAEAQPRILDNIWPVLEPIL